MLTKSSSLSSSLTTVSWYVFQRLAEIAHSLLKVSPYDPESMACTGLQRYMNHVLPVSEWENDAMRPALVTILRRLDKVFLKISKKPSIRVGTLPYFKFKFPKKYFKDRIRSSLRENNVFVFSLSDSSHCIKNWAPDLDK